MKIGRLTRLDLKGGGVYNIGRRFKKGGGGGYLGAAIVASNSELVRAIIARSTLWVRTGLLFVSTPARVKCICSKVSIFTYPIILFQVPCL